jgi:hypothetical protein
MLCGDRLLFQALIDLERGDMASATDRLEEAIDRGVSPSEAIELLVAMAAESGETEGATEAARRFLSDPRFDLSPLDRARIEAGLLLPLLTNNDLGLDEVAPQLIGLLAQAAAAGPGGWEVVDHPAIRAAIHDCLGNPETAVDVAEQLLYAPEATGWPALALGQVEAIGLASTGDPARALSTERLLHAAGRPEAAYRVQAARRLRPAPRPRVLRASNADPLAGVIVAVAGGHPGLRAAIGREVMELGGEVREIPSRFEAVRRERDVAGAVQGAGIVITIVPQIAHSTSDQVSRAARRLGVPAVNVRTARVRAVIDAAVSWASSRESGRDR